MNVIAFGRGYLRGPNFAAIAGSLALVAFGSPAITHAWVGYLQSLSVPFPPVLSGLVLKGTTGDLVAIGLLVFIGPLFEELLARGAFLRALLWFYRPGVAVALSAIAFAVFHGNVYQALPALWLGLVLGVVFARTGNIMLCVFGYAFYNAQAVLLSYFATEPLLVEPWLLGVTRVVALVFGLVLLWRALSTIRPEERPQWRQGTTKRTPITTPT